MALINILEKYCGLQHAYEKYRFEVKHPVFTFILKSRFIKSYFYIKIIICVKQIRFHEKKPTFVKDFGTTDEFSAK